jgi:hypothetical protein
MTRGIQDAHCMYFVCFYTVHTHTHVFFFKTKDGMMQRLFLNCDCLSPSYSIFELIALHCVVVSGSCIKIYFVEKVKIKER